jgi:membrane fusion protein, heavy metal efflux system
MMIPESQLEQVRIGTSVVVEPQAGSRRQSGHISHLGSVVDENSRTAEAHAEIPNSDRFWKPGMFVTLKLQTHPTPVKMAVKSSAIQFLNEEPFVFVRSGEQIQGFPVVTGLETSEWIEIKSGLQTGQSYVAENAYVIKAELEKSSAAHSH